MRVFLERATTFAALAGTLIFTLILVTDSYVEPIHTRKALEDSVRGYILPTDAQVEDIPAHTLRVYRYWIDARVNPALALPGADLSELLDALSALDSSIRQTMPYLNPKTRRSVAKSYHPTYLMRALATAEEARRDFTANPSIETARAYHWSLNSAFYAYETEANRYLSVISRLSDRVGFSLGGETRLSFIASQINAARKYVAAAFSEEKIRYDCLEGRRSDCPSPALTAPSSLFEPTLQRLPSTARQVRMILDTYYGSRERRITYAPFDQSTDKMPSLLLDTSTCMPNESPMFKLWWSNSRLSGIRAAFTTTINELFFYDLNKTSGAFYEELRRGDIEYDYQPLNLYLCVDAPRELATTLTAYTIAYELDRNPITMEPGEERRGVPDELALFFEAQSRLDVDAEILSVRAVEYAIATAQSARQALGEQGLESFLGRSRVERLNELILLWHTKSADIESVLGNVEDSLLFLRAVSQYQEISADALYMTRSFPSLFFQLANESVVPTFLSLIEKPEGVSLDKMNIVTYPTDLSGLFSPTELIEYLEKEGRADEETLRHL